MQTWSLKQLDADYYKSIGLPVKIFNAVSDVIDSILIKDIEPQKRLSAYTILDKQLAGANIIYRAPVVRSIAGAQEVQKAVSNGCGPSGLGIFPGGWWEECCDEHDACYSLGGSQLDRLACDAKFYKCLYAHGAPIIAEIYTLAVVLFGWVSFGPDEEEDHTSETAPKPNPCTGICVGKEIRIESLSEFRLVDSRYNSIIDFVPNDARAQLIAESEAMSTIDYTRRCSSKCKCDITYRSKWRASNTTITIPTNDPNSRDKYACRARIWIREVSGECVGH